MPNWCNNYLEVYFDINNPTQVSYVNAMKVAADNQTLLNFLKPMPAHQPDVTKPNPFFATGPLSSDTERSFGPNNSWYNWSLNNWGTKWEADVYAVDLSEGLLAISFDTAWGPPTIATSILKTLGYGFKHWYFEPGMNFYGESNPDGDFDRQIDFDAHNVTNTHSLYTALQHMCERDGIDDDIIDRFNMVDCYYNPDYDGDDNKNDINEDAVEGA